MRTVKRATESVMQIWGEQELKDVDYRLCQYVLRTECEDGTLLHHNVSGELVLLTAEETECLDSLPWRRTEVMTDLIRRHFLVTVDHDDRRTVDQLRKIFRILNTNRDITHYHILPTSNCIARCFYCYEHDMPRENMSEETGFKVVEFIADHCGKNRKVTLDWFGGEPTLGIERIDQISRGLREKQIRFTSLMISNGYLFSDELIRRATEIWNLTDIQITLDGTEEIYNRTKAYVNAENNPYHTVLDNITKLARQKICVVIRLNLDSHNMNDLEMLIDELEERFSQNKYINVYVAIIHENLGTAPIRHEVPDEQRLEMKWNELQNRLLHAGLRHSKEDLPRLEYNFCMAGDDSTVLITPSGNLAKCEHKIYDSVVGSLDTGIEYQDEVESWKREGRWARCLQCNLYPNCYFLERCSIARKCTDSSIERGILKKIQSMKKSYRMWKKVNEEGEIYMETRIFSDELKNKAKECLSNLPITINTHFGDPFQPDQWENTLYKLHYLKNQNYQGEIEVSTKWILTNEQIDTLYSINPDLWIFCGITGLNEKKGVTQEDRLDNYLRICKKFKKTVVSVRPLIPGKNDSMEILTPIIETVAKGRGYLHHGGYRNPYNKDGGKTQYDELKVEIRKLCRKLGVDDAPRCTCIVSDVTGKICSTYDELEPANLDVLEALGFQFEIEDGYVNLTGYGDSNEVTRGDVSFARLVIQSSRIRQNWTDPHENMQMRGPAGQVMLCTSSWFHWAREVQCMVNCFYCHVRPGTPIHIESGDSGCSPLDIYKMIFENGETEA